MENNFLSGNKKKASRFFFNKNKLKILFCSPFDDCKKFVLRWLVITFTGD